METTATAPESTLLQAYTIFHVAISLLAIISGFIVLFGMLANKRLEGRNKFFLITTVLTSVTGFFFPFHGITPGIIVGIISLVVLAVAIYARYGGHLNGGWRKTYVITAAIALYPERFRPDRAVVPKNPRTSLAGSDPKRATVQDDAACHTGSVCHSDHLCGHSLPQRCGLTNSPAAIPLRLEANCEVSSQFSASSGRRCRVHLAKALIIEVCGALFSLAREKLNPRLECERVSRPAAGYDRQSRTNAVTPLNTLTFLF